MNTTPTLEVYFRSEYGTPQHFTARANFATKAEAEAFLSNFPKKLKGSFHEVTCCYDAPNYFVVEFKADFRSEKNNTINETGIARFRGVVASNLFTFNGESKFNNAYRTLEAALAAIANSENEAN
jgi:hypothetical protein